MGMEDSRDSQHSSIAEAPETPSQRLFEAWIVLDCWPSSCDPQSVSGEILNKYRCVQQVFDMETCLFTVQVLWVLSSVAMPLLFNLDLCTPFTYFIPFFFNLYLLWLDPDAV